MGPHAYLGIQQSLGVNDGVLLGCDTQFVVINMVPKLLHVLPVSNDAALDGILEIEDTLFV